jgi:hypothetical protein
VCRVFFRGIRNWANFSINLSFIILLALFYVVLDNDLDTIKSLVESYAPKAMETEADDDNYIREGGGGVELIQCTPY